MNPTLPIGRVIPLAMAATLWWCVAATGQPLATEIVANGMNRPIGCKAPPDDASRLFIVEKRGVIKILELPGHTVRETPFLDIDSRVVNITGNNDERGLLGLAFHPDYASNGRFFVNYVGNTGATKIAEYRVTGDPNIADFGSESILLTIGQPQQNHNGGCLQFGPDGMLYAGMGDGGSAGDPHGAIGNGQALDTLLGKMLRLDVDAEAPYIPSDNPFVGAGDPLDEIWAYGLRNPWRFSFDRETGDMYIADVGQSGWEEIDFQPASSMGGENYAWRCMEGNSCFNPNAGPNCTCNDPGLVDPIHVYRQGGFGSSVTGGYVYRGNVLLAEVGNYFFGDYVTGQTWTFRVVDGSATEFAERTSELGLMGTVASFCEDAAGELYMVRQIPADVVKIISSDPCTGCEDGLFCNGLETCVNECQPGGDPCPGQFCRESDDQCVECLSGADCSDGASCTADSCDPAGACVFTPVDCPAGQQCDPVDGLCKECKNDEVCAPEEFCDPRTFVCRPGCRDDSACEGGMRCDPATGVCVECLSSDDCTDDGLFCNGVATCTDGTCQPGIDPCVGQECNEENDSCVLIGNAANGGLLYDNWLAALGVAAPQTDHPLWQFRPDQTSNSRTGAATWRCKECHGWDYKGVDGQYGSGSHRTGITGVLGTLLSPVELATLLSDSPSGSVPNGHSYDSVLSESQLNDLVAFVLHGGAVDYDAYVDPTGAIKGDPVQGQTNYAMGGCLSCHGADGTLRNFGSPENPEWVGTVATSNPWEFFHKVRFGQPGSLPRMPAWSVGGGAIEGIADVGIYVQDNFPVDCTDDSHCGGNTPCGRNFCADGLCGFTKKLYGDLVGDEGACGSNAAIDLSDLLAVLNGFAGQFPDGCGLEDIDLAGDGGSCSPDNDINLSDILAVLNAFQGADPCCQ